MVNSREIETNVRSTYQGADVERRKDRELSEKARTTDATQTIEKRNRAVNGAV